LLLSGRDTHDAKRLTREVRPGLPARIL
jgi:hypothetical protein